MHPLARVMMDSLAGQMIAYGEVFSKYLQELSTEQFAEYHQMYWSAVETMIDIWPHFAKHLRVQVLQYAVELDIELSRRILEKAPQNEAN
jgi:hypothetical protein